MKHFFFVFLIYFNLVAYGEGDFEGQGEVAFEFRSFEDDSDDQTIENNLSIFTRLEESYKGENSKHILRGFARADKKDRERSVIIIEDAYLSWEYGDEEITSFLIGKKLFNWTATEAFHPNDFVNSRNFDSDLENIEKKGEAVVELNQTFGNGEVSLYYFPRFSAPKFPGRRSHLSQGVGLASPIIYEGNRASEDYNVFQYGAKFEYGFDFADVGIYALRHIDRSSPIIGTNAFTYNPFLNVNLPNDLNTFKNNPTPYFFETFELGMNLTIPLETFILKFEGNSKNFLKEEIIILTPKGLRRPTDYKEVVLGLEVPFSHDSGAETNVFAEFSGLFGVVKETRAELSLFQRDLFLGLRHAINDEMGTEYFFSMITDLERKKERLFNLSFARRLSDIWKMKVGMKVYSAPQKGDSPLGLELYDKDSHAQVTFTRYF